MTHNKETVERQIEINIGASKQSVCIYSNR